jgi:hypothetical protein
MWIDGLSKQTDFSVRIRLCDRTLDGLPSSSIIDYTRLLRIGLQLIRILAGPIEIRLVVPKAD